MPDMSDTPGTPGTPAPPAPRGPVLVTGATGLVGHHLCRRLSVSRRVLAVSRTIPARHAPRGGLGPAAARLVDIRDADALAALLDAAEPAAVVHLAALARPDECERDPEGSRAVNLEASAALAGLCATRGVRLAFASTDLVFGGDPGNDGPPYHETAAPAPVCVYGAHKARAEAAVLERCPGALVCRLPLLYGAPPPGRRGPLSFLLDALGSGAEVTLFFDEWRAMLDVADAAAGLEAALDSGLGGVLHLPGPERLSRLEFGELFRDAARALGLGELRIRPVSRLDAGLPAPRPADVTLASTRTAALGFLPARAAEALPRLLRRMTPGREGSAAAAR